MKTNLSVVVATCLFSLVTAASEATVSKAVGSLEDKHTSFGAFGGPAVLPNGASATYAYAGVPEVGGGYRQGFGLFEAQGRARLNYISLAVTLDAQARYLAFRQGPWRIAPSLALGATFNSGTRYIDAFNFSYVGIKLTPGAAVTYRLAETVNLLGELQVPIDIPLTTSGSRVTPVLGAGAEVYLGEDITAGAMADFGLDVIKEPGGVPQSRFAFALRVGLGYRFF